MIEDESKAQQSVTIMRQMTAALRPDDLPVVSDTVENFIVGVGYGLKATKDTAVDLAHRAVKEGVALFQETGLPAAAEQTADLAKWVVVGASVLGIAYIYSLYKKV